jgi:hypothetical protein
MLYDLLAPCLFKFHSIKFEALFKVGLQIAYVILILMQVLASNYRNKL